MLPEAERPKEQQFPPEVAFGISLAARIREKIKPMYGRKQQDVPIHQISKDFNYAVDVLAEKEIQHAFSELWERGINYGYVTEDQGLVLPPSGTAEYIYLIDPVDGSRPAQIGAEMATITMVGIPGDRHQATFEDIAFGVTHAIKEDEVYIAQKGRGVTKIVRGESESVRKREHVSGNLKDASMVNETYSMSAELTGRVIDPLNREISFKTEYPSGSYSALSLVRGQNELHVDVRRRLVTDYPHLPVSLKPNSKSLFPMDIAAGWLGIQELGGKVTDGYGKSLNTVRLWEFDQTGAWSQNNEISWIAAVTPELHAKALAKIEEGFALLPR